MKGLISLNPQYSSLSQRSGDGGIRITAKILFVQSKFLSKVELSFIVIVVAWLS